LPPRRLGRASASRTAPGILKRRREPSRERFASRHWRPSAPRFWRSPMPHFRFVDVRCPWPGCSIEIELVDLCLELMGQEIHDGGMAAWRDGRPLVGRCPGCKQYVSFGYEGKSSVAGDPAVQGAFVLPDDWYEQAVLIDPK